MRRQLKRYPDYRPSRMQWLESVPSHWEERRAKFFLREVDERSVSGNEEMLSVSHLTGVTPRHQKNVTMFHAASYEGHKLCRPNDVVVNTMWAWMAALGVSRYAGLVSPAYGVYRPSHSDAFVPAYLDQLLRLAPYASEYLCRSTGITSSRLRLYPDRFLDIPLLRPPMAEQERIVRYIRHSVRKANVAIGVKQRLIDLLKEQKRAVAHSGVTAGIASGVPLIESGLPGVGKIPAHWKIMRLKQLCDRIVDCKHGTPDLVPGGNCTVVRTTAVRDGDFRAFGSFPTDETNYRLWTMRGAPRTGDVFLTREAPAGEACLVPDVPMLCMGQRMMYLRPDPAVLDSRFLLHSIYGPAVQTFIDLTSNGSTVSHLNVRQVHSLPILWCPLAEQQQIADSIHERSEPIEMAISRVSREIALIREYRDRLVADVITGNLDVQDMASTLPEEDIDELNDIDQLLDVDITGDDEVIQTENGEE